MKLLKAQRTLSACVMRVDNASPSLQSSLQQHQYVSHTFGDWGFSHFCIRSLMLRSILFLNPHCPIRSCLDGCKLQFSMHCQRLKMHFRVFSGAESHIPRRWVARDALGCRYRILWTFDTIPPTRFFRSCECDTPTNIDSMAEKRGWNSSQANRMQIRFSSHRLRWISD